MGIPTFKTGTGINEIGTCDAEITGESSTFKKDEKIWCLYRHGACVQLSAGDFKLYRNNILVDTYPFPSYRGYVYVRYQNFSAGSYRVVCTIGSVVMSKNFTVEPDLTSPKGEIVSVDYPSEANAGERVDIDYEIKNIGGASGNFRMCIDTYCIPAIGYETLDAGESISHTLKPEMQNHDFDVVVKLWRQT